MSLLNIFPKSLGKLIDIIFPKLCPVCNSPLQIPSNAPLCKGCFSNIEKNLGPKCTICDEPFSAKSANSHICGRCLKEPPYFNRAYSLFLYNGAIEALIKGFKYRKDFSCLNALITLCKKEKVLEHFKDVHVILPVPLHRNKLKKRGFNHSYLIAKRLFPTKKVASNLVIKIVDNKPQMSLPAKKRAENIKGVFLIEDKTYLKKYKNYLIVDDIMTTGATVNEVAKVLKRGGASKIFVLTIARTPI